jgi:hypothetical protein
MADPRDMAADVKDQLEAFQTAVERVRTEGIKKLISVGRKEWRGMHADFIAEKYADAAGNIRSLGPITERWRKRKVALGKLENRGRFSNGIERTIKSRKSFIPIEGPPAGFDIDLLAPDLTTRVPLRVPDSKLGPKSKRVKVNEYLAFYEEQKAPGLGSLSTDAMDRINDAVDKAQERALKRLRNITISAAKGGRERVVQVRAMLRRFAA